jgi:hypothetical protein
MSPKTWIQICIRVSHPEPDLDRTSLIETLTIFKGLVAVCHSFSVYFSLIHIDSYIIHSQTFAEAQFFADQFVS